MMHIFLFFPTISPAVDCFEDMSPFAASNFDSPLAAQTEEAENGSELHFCTTSCSVQLQFGNVSTTDGVWPSSCKSNEFFSALQMPVLQGADGPTLRIQGRTGNRSGDRGSYHWAQLLCLEFSWYPIRSLECGGAFSPLVLLLVYFRTTSQRPNQILPSNWAAFRPIQRPINWSLWCRIFNSKCCEQVSRGSVLSRRI